MLVWMIAMKNHQQKSDVECCGWYVSLRNELKSRGRVDGDLMGPYVHFQCIFVMFSQHLGV
jgi:hypothetical protein